MMGCEGSGVAWEGGTVGEWGGRLVRGLTGEE